MNNKENQNKKSGDKETEIKEEKPRAGVSPDGACLADKEVSVKESELRKLKEDAAKAAEYWERLLRQQAEFENIRKRMERERQDFLKFANEGLIAELLDVLDDLERTVGLAENKCQDISVFLKGVEMILAHLYELLKRHGVKPLEAAGKQFDPHYHEALMQCDDALVPEHTVLEELQKGYLLHDRVVRTAKVKVSKKPCEPPQTEKQS
ncbi:MAG: nucleotide exchange factor GrpE [Candidatus Omnitrophota bacterium]|jgi:molecular chaperone GrpE